MQGPNHRLWSATVATCLLVFSSAHAAEKLEIYALQQRQAEELLPIIRPMLPPGSAINGQSYTLIVRGDAATHAMVSEILQKLDGKLHNLQISVKFSSPAVTHRRSTGAQIQLQTDDDNTRITAGAGSTPRHSDTTIDIRGRAVAASAGLNESMRVDNEDSDYRLRVVEGREAFIQTGTTLPYRTQIIYPGGIRQNSLQFHDARSGFYVRPRLNGEQVLLDILPHQQKPAGHGRIDTQHVQTTVSGYLGQWIELGGASTTRQFNTNQALTAASGTQNKNTSIFVKVEVIQ